MSTRRFPVAVWAILGGFAAALPLCRNSTFMATRGRWLTSPQRFRLNDDAAYRCRLGTFGGISALEALGRGSTTVFIGDSLLREFYFSIIQGCLRGQPVVIDPVFGKAHYVASISGDSLHAADTFGISSKHIADVFNHSSSSENDIEVSFQFFNRCEDVRLWLERAPPTYRRMTVITNVGASTVRGNPDHLRCMSSSLPAAFVSAVRQWGPHRHRLIVMNQPTDNNRFRGLPRSTVAEVNAAVSRGLDKINKQTTALNLRGQPGAALLLDYSALLQQSFLDPSAPADAIYPLVDDQLHYGCKWERPTGCKNLSSCPRGLEYPPIFVKGTRVINTHSGSSEEPALELECQAGLFRALGNLLLTLIAEDKAPPGTPAFDFHVKTCYPQYDRVPCPLFPRVPTAASWEGNLSNVEDTRVNQLARLRAADKRDMHVGSMEHTWCETAVLERGSDRRGVSPREGSLGEQALSEPLGQWCALPASGVLEQKPPGTPGW